MKKTFMRIFTLLSIMLFLSRCGKDVPPPTYLHIDEFTLDMNIDVNYGQLTHAFMDVFVYVDNQNFGVFQLPCVIPLNLEGAHEVRLLPAVRTNGQSGAKTRYPFVEPHVQQINFVRLDTAQIAPRTKYYSTTQVWYEDFEDAAVQIESTAQSLTNLGKSNDPEILEARNGNFYGYVSLNETENIWDGITNANWSISPSQLSYLEIDFYNTNSIQTGLQSTGSGGINNLMHVLIVAQKPEDLRWRKMYIDLRQVVSSVGVGNTFNLKLVALLEQAATESFIAIDNIKLVYR